MSALELFTQLVVGVVAIAGGIALIVIAANLVAIIICAANEFSDLFIHKLEVKVRRLKQ